MVSSTPNFCVHGHDRCCNYYFTGDVDTHINAMKWRTERNWWIALYALSLYAFLYLYNCALQTTILERDHTKQAKDK